MAQTQTTETVTIRRGPLETLISEVERKIRTNGGLEKNESLSEALGAVVRDVSGADLRVRLETALPIPALTEGGME